MCNGVLARTGKPLPDSATDTQIAHYLKHGMAEQVAEDEAEAAAKPKTKKPAKPAETK
jgi:hypothetical protein